MKISLSDHFTYRKLLKFVAPSAVMMMFTSIYGVVDGLFVSNYVGKVPFAAINLVMPFIMILGGIVSGMYFEEYDKGLFYLAMYYVFFVQENGGIKVVIKEREKDEKSENKAE